MWPADRASRPIALARKRIRSKNLARDGLRPFPLASPVSIVTETSRGAATGTGYDQPPTPTAYQISK